MCAATQATGYLRSHRPTAPHEIGTPRLGHRGRVRYPQSQQGANLAYIFSCKYRNSYQSLSSIEKEALPHKSPSGIDTARATVRRLVLQGEAS